MGNFKLFFFSAVLAPALLTCVPLPAPAQDTDRIDAVLRITGASSEEDLDEQEVERYMRFLSHPLEINSASRSRLLSSGLLTRYQVASLEEYRSVYGDVLSFSELSLVDGFGEEITRALRPFLSLSSHALPGASSSDTMRTRQDYLARIAYKSGDSNYGIKYRLEAGGRVDFSFAARNSYQDKLLSLPSSWSANITFHSRKRVSKVVLGDYNLRLGQGLSLWSGLSLSGLSSSSSFSRKPTGLSSSWSWSNAGGHRGVAADYQLGRFYFVSFLSSPGLRQLMEKSSKGPPGLMSGASVGWFGRNGQASFCAWGSSERGGTLGKGKVSGDLRWNFSGVDIFAESAFDLKGKSLAAVAGVSARIGEDWRLSSVARLYPASFDGSFSGGVRSWSKTSDERGVAVGLERFGASLTVDLASKMSDFSKRQCKVFMKIPFQVGDEVVLSVRATERIRPYEEYLVYKTGVRVDLDWSSAGISARYGENDGDSWKVRTRLEGSLCRSMGGLLYLEGGRKTDKWYVYSRGTLFFVDYWDDRIYSYERDAPGNFTVPAYYGRGISFSAVGGRKFYFKKRKALKVYFRASNVRYPFMREPKPSVFEAKIQAVASL